jgi:hypothetical protein
MSEIKPVSIKTAEERYENLSSPVLPDIAFRDCLKSEATELRAALEALQETNAAQAKRIAHLEYKIDELMLEWCPDEMTPEQIANYAAHQVKVVICNP